MVNYLLKEYTTGHAFAEYEGTILRYMQPANMIPRQYVGSPIGKSGTVANVYDECTLNDVFIEGGDQSIRHSLQNYWVTDPQADLTDIASQAETLLSIQKGSGQQPTVNQRSKFWTSCTTKSSGTRILPETTPTRTLWAQRHVTRDVGLS